MCDCKTGNPIDGETDTMRKTFLNGVFFEIHQIYKALEYLAYKLEISEKFNILEILKLLKPFHPFTLFQRFANLYHLSHSIGDC